MLAKLIVVVTSQHMHKPNHYVARFKLTGCYMSMISQYNWQWRTYSISNRWHWSNWNATGKKKKKKNEPGSKLHT